MFVLGVFWLILYLQIYKTIHKFEEYLPN